MAEAKYKQIADELRRMIDEGEAAPGAQLPTESELMKQYGASRNTVRDAIQQLSTRGMVEARGGQGTFVKDRPPPVVITLTGDPDAGDPAATGESQVKVFLAGIDDSEITPSAAKLDVDIKKADSVLADALRIEEGATIVGRHQHYVIEGPDEQPIPWARQTSYYPMSFVEQGATRLIEPDSIEGGVVAYLDKVLSIRQVGYRDAIQVRPPDPDETVFFKLPADGRVYEIFRVAFSNNTECPRIRLTVTVYDVDRSRLLVEVGEVPSSQRSQDARRGS